MLLTPQESSIFHFVPKSFFLASFVGTHDHAQKIKIWRVVAQF